MANSFISSLRRYSALASINRLSIAQTSSRNYNRTGRGFSVLIHSDAGSDAASSPYKNQVSVNGQHHFVVDEPASVGGKNLGPNPYDLLLSALGSCTSMTIQMYAQRKKLPLQGIDVKLTHSKIYQNDAEGCTESSEAKKSIKIHKIERIISLRGDKLTETERKRLLEIANMCPVHKTLTHVNVIETVLNPVASAASNSEGKAAFEQIIPGRSHILVPGKESGSDFIVRRILPYSKRRSIGPFVFLDHFGPVDINKTPAMNVGPHPHIGLSTVTLLYEGAVMHRDSTGAKQAILPNEINLMVAGKGAVHTERGEISHLIPLNDKSQRIQEGLQLWIALSKEVEACLPAFYHCASEDVPDISKSLTQISNKSAGVKAKLVIGQYEALTASPKITIDDHQRQGIFLIDVALTSAGDSITLRYDALPGYDNSNPERPIELGVYVSQGSVAIGSGNWEVKESDLAVYNISKTSKPGTMTITAKGKSRVAILGGLKLPEPRHMFWNFVSTSKETISAAVESWKILDRSKFPLVVDESNSDSLPIPDNK